MRLQAPPITADDFAPYRWLACADGRAGRPINDGSRLPEDDVGPLALTAAGGAPCLALFRARARDPRAPSQVLERHCLGTQTFVPMGGLGYVTLAATATAAPDVSALAAFMLAGHQAVRLRAGTWHHGPIALQNGDFVIVERHAAEADCELTTLDYAVTLILPE